MDLGGTSAATSGLRRWLIVACVGLGFFANALDTTVNVALPSISRAFDADFATIQWIIIVFVTTNTSLSIGLGSAADLFSHRRFFLAGLLCYGLAMLLMAFATSFETVVVLRVLQGVGTATIAAVGPALVGLAFAAGQRGRGLGVMTSAQAAGAVAAGFGGGVLVDAFGWSAIFVARLPFILVAFVLALVVLKEDPRQPKGTERLGTSGARFDAAGAGTLFAAIACLLLGLSLMRSWGATSPYILSLLAAAVLSGGIFVAIERSAERPVLDLGLFRQLVFASVFVTLFLNQLGVFVVWFVFPYFVTDVLEQPAGVLGALLGVMAVSSALTALLGGWLSDRLGPHRLVTLASALSALALWWLSQMTMASTVALVALPMMLVGAGLGVLNAASVTLALNSVPAGRFGTASGALTLARTFGVVLSVALFGAFVAARTDVHILRLLETATMTESAMRLNAFVLAFHEAFVAGALLAGAGALVSLLAWRKAAA